LQGDEAAPQSGMVRFRFVLVPKRSTTIQKFLDLKLAAFPAKAASVFNLSIMILHCSTKHSCVEILWNIPFHHAITGAS
jgi:hypothetical protein